MTENEKILKILERIERMLILTRRRKPAWVTIAEVKELTIWKTSSHVRRAKEMGNLIPIERNGKILYKLNDIDDRFFIKKHPFGEEDISRIAELGAERIFLLLLQNECYRNYFTEQLLKEIKKRKL